MKANCLTAAHARSASFISSLVGLVSALIFTMSIFSSTARAQFSVVGSGGSSSRGGAPTWRLAAHGGFSSQEFSGVWGSSFERLSGTYYSFLATRSFLGGWHNGLQYVENSGNNVNPFLLTTFQKGEYKLKFTRLQYLTGFAAGSFRAYLLAGLENIAWTGTPDLGLLKKSEFHYGLMMSFDLIGGSTFKVPLVLTALKHGRRDFVFSRFPDDTVEANPGLEVSIGAGVALDF